MRRLIGFERKGEPLASEAAFVRRLGRNVTVAAAVILASLVVGTTGYITLEGMNLIDAVLNASMILSTMGPVSPLHTTGGKIFASVYAILSGLLLFAVAGLMLAPVYHRMIHRFHLEDEDAE